MTNTSTDITEDKKEKIMEIYNNVLSKYPKEVGRLLGYASKMRKVPKGERGVDKNESN